MPTKNAEKIAQAAVYIDGKPIKGVQEIRINGKTIKGVLEIRIDKLRNGRKGR